MAQLAPLRRITLRKTDLRTFKLCHRPQGRLIWLIAVTAKPPTVAGGVFTSE
jgi:hypothetical protein